MHCSVTLSDVFLLMHMKMCIHAIQSRAWWPVIRYVCVFIDTVQYGCLIFMGIRIYGFS